MSNNKTDETTIIKKAQGPFDTMSECIETTMEEEDVDEETAREICENMDEEEEEDTEEASLHELDSNIVQPRKTTTTTTAPTTVNFPTASADEVIEDLETDMGNEFMGDRDPVSGDLSGSIHTLPAATADETEKELDNFIVKTAQREPGETVAECVERVMAEEDVDEETAREACSAPAGDEEE